MKELAYGDSMHAVADAFWLRDVWSLETMYRREVEPPRRGESLTTNFALWTHYICIDYNVENMSQA